MSIHIRKIIYYCIFIISLSSCFDVRAVSLVTLKTLDVAKSNLNVFSTPLAITDEGLYVVYVKNSSTVNTGINLSTVLSKGVAKKMAFGHGIVM